MHDTTLIVLAWHRPEYLARCLESWGNARGSQDLRRVTVRLARSDPEMEAANCDVARNAANQFNLPVNVVLDDPEDAGCWGPDRPLGMEINSSFSTSECQFVIECDEDIIVSDDILEYFTWARQLEPAVDCVCAHNNLGQGWSKPCDDTGAEQDVIRVYGEFTSWCFGISWPAWEKTWLPKWDWSRSSGDHPMEHGWEWQMHRQASQGLRVAIPDASRCQNIGEYGGTFSHPSLFQGTQAHSFREHREPLEYRLVP